MPHTPAVFAIDAFDGYFHGITAGQCWNGFACPLFTIEEGKRLAAINNATDFCGRLEYDEKTDTFLHYDYDNEDQGPQGYPVTLIDGQKFYPIGAFGWTWYEVTEDENAQISASLFAELTAMQKAGIRVPDKAFSLAATESEVDDVMNMKVSDAADLLIQLADTKA